MEELEHAQRRAAAAQDETRAANAERDAERDHRMRLETELARARRQGGGRLYSHDTLTRFRSQLKAC